MCGSELSGMSYCCALRRFGFATLLRQQPVDASASDAASQRGPRHLGVVNKHGPNSIIAIRIGGVNTATNVNLIPSYCDETCVTVRACVKLTFSGIVCASRLCVCVHVCVQNALWDSPANIAGQFLDSSDGFTFDKAISTVLTVQTSFALGTTCDFDGLAAAANAAALAAGYNTDNYSYRLYYIPSEYPCNWGGLAYVGCSSPRYCRAWTRYASPGIVDHELGHSAGECVVCVCCTVPYNKLIV